MTDSSYPPPPPPPGSRRKPGFHGPETNWFPGVRRQLAALEQPPRFRSSQERNRGVFLSFITSGILGFLLAFLIELIFTSAIGTDWRLVVVLGPVTEELTKSSGLLIVGFFVWKMIPDRRHSVALGAAAGFGFGLVEDILYAYQFLVTGHPELVVNRIPTPFAHALWSGLVALGFFALLAKTADKHRGQTFVLFFLFLLAGTGSHMLWNTIAILPAYGLWGPSYLATLLDVLIVMTFSAFLLRDFLGGHFNFQNFFETSEQQAFYEKILPPPPPPPPP
jgi:RsiW-degrading membrane proteinase PrsW (M82 family)